MLLECPAWVEHTNGSGEKCAIYGVDIHPDGTRFVTGGGDEKVKIWSVESIFEPDAEKEPHCTKLLATLSWHQNSVNCVRWSHNGRYLATGGDDTFVMLYELQTGKTAVVPFGTNEKPNLENWVRVSTLKSHSMNVEDIAWSPDDRMLATCSIDNKIIIWSIDTRTIPLIMNEPFRVLSGHTSWVKGVTWDPVGKYLASAGEDKTVIVWRVDDWKIEKKITEPFEHSAGSSYFRRLSWSPDGMSICATNGFKSKKDVAPLIERGGEWENQIDFVGHQSAITCARFNPRLLRKEKSGKEFACCAIGGEDRTISIWLAQVSRPLAIIKDCFTGSVTDLCWSTAGNVLLGSSIDGSLCCFRFEANEIGQPVPQDEQNRLLFRKFGTRAGTTAISEIAENPHQLAFEDSPNKATKGSPLTKRLKTTHVHAPAASTTQVESTSKSGKRRITPVLLNSTSSAASPATVEKRRVVPETIAGPSTETAAVSTPPRHRKYPDILNTGSPGQLSAPPSPTSESSAMVISSPKPKRTQPETQSSPAVSKIMSKSKGRARKNSNSSGAKVIRKFSRSKRIMIPSPDPQVNFNCSFVPPGSEDAVVLEGIVRNIKMQEETNAILPTGPIFSSLSCSQGGTMLWSDRFSGCMTLLSANNMFTAVALQGGSIYMLRSATGRRILPCIELGRDIAVLECSPDESSFVLTITTPGMIKVWNLSTQKAMLSDSLDSILTGPPVMDDSGQSHLTTTSLIRTRISATGQPLLTIAVEDPVNESKHLRSFTYHYDMECWVRLADDGYLPSDFETVLPPQMPTGPLRRLQHASAQSRSTKGLVLAMLSDMTNSCQQSVTKSHLENQMASAVALQSVSEYQYWLRAYVRYLSTDEDETRVRDFFNDLIGPPSGSLKNGKKWEATILAKNRNLQRLVADYQLQLDQLSLKNSV